jgi:hypothetical protein
MIRVVVVVLKISAAAVGLGGEGRRHDVVVPNPGKRYLRRCFLASSSHLASFPLQHALHFFSGPETAVVLLLVVYNPPSPPSLSFFPPLLPPRPISSPHACSELSVCCVGSVPRRRKEWFVPNTRVCHYYYYYYR